MLELIDLGKQILGQLSNGNFDKELISLAISKCLGYGILVGASLVKVPQLVAIIQKKSGRGLSLIALECEAFSCTLNSLYGFILSLPISTYGENIFIWIQHTILLNLVYWYEGQQSIRVLSLWVLIGGILGAAASGMIPPDLMSQLHVLSVPLITGVRLPQIIANYQSKSTGMLSPVTMGLIQAGSAARVYTSIRENAGPSMVRQCVLGFVFASILMFQIVWYTYIKPRLSRKVAKKTQ